jgi:hypothetical protein
MRKRSHHENFVSVMAVHLTIGEENVAMQTRAVPIYPGKKTLQSRPGVRIWANRDRASRTAASSANRPWCSVET